MKKKDRVDAWPVEAKAGLALVLTSAFIVGGALLIGGSAQEDNSDFKSDVGALVSSENSTMEESSINEVTEKIETLFKPFTVEASCSRYYYDMSDDASIRALAIVPVPNKTSTYMKSVGVDYIYQGQVFDVVAATSGTVIESLNDSIYGNMVIVEHESGIQTIYASLENVDVKEGEIVKQGDKIATSGESLYTSGLGSCLHFEVVKGDTYLNPEKSYTLEITKL